MKIFATFTKTSKTFQELLLGQPNTNAQVDCKAMLVCRYAQTEHVQA